MRVRRYLCTRCESVLTVVPREIVARRHFGAGAIGVAIALLGLLGRMQHAVRDAVGGRSGSRSGWITLRRWLRAIVDARLFGAIGALSAHDRASPSAQLAAVISQRLRGFGPRPEVTLGAPPILAEVYAGAVHIARAA